MAMHPLLDRVNERVDLARRALHIEQDAPVAQVFDEAGDLELPSDLEHRVAKAHALHPPRKVNALMLHIIHL